MDYTIEDAPDTEHLIMKVKNRLALGWIPQGGVMASSDTYSKGMAAAVNSTVHFYQAMIYLGSDQ